MNNFVSIQNLTILIIINIVLTIFLFYICWNKKARIEGLENKESFEEAIMNLSSVLDEGKMKVTDLEVTQNLKVGKDANIVGKTTTGSSKIGSFEIRGDKIGVPGRMDLHFSPDKWLRHYEYNKNKHINGVGVAAQRSWAGEGVWTNKAYINGVLLDKVNSGVFRIMAPLEVNGALGGGNMNKPGIIANNLVLGPSANFTWGKSWWTGPGHNTAVNVAKQLPVGSLVIGPPIGNNNSQVNDWDRLVSAAKRIGKANCNVRGMYLDLQNHGGALACK